MQKIAIEIAKIVEENQPDIDRLKKMAFNIQSVANIRYWYWLLANFKKTPNQHEDLMAMEALTTSIIISYGRLFSAGNGN